MRLTDTLHRGVGGQFDGRAQLPGNQGMGPVAAGRTLTGSISANESPILVRGIAALMETGWEAFCTRKSAAEVWRSRRFGPCGGVTLSSVFRPWFLRPESFPSPADSIPD